MVRLTKEKMEELKIEAWKHAIENGSYGYNQGKFFLIFPDGRFSDPLDSSNIQNEGWTGNIGRFDFQNAYDYGDFSDYVRQVMGMSDNQNVSSDDFTEEEWNDLNDDFINSIADDYNLALDNVTTDYDENSNEPGFNKMCRANEEWVPPYYRRDGTYVHGFCRRIRR